MRHNAIIVTSWNREELYAARAVAVDYFGVLVSQIVSSEVNNYESFFIAPDGSKEGWETSDNHDHFRAEYITWLNRRRYVDGSTPLQWAEIQYGDDEGVTKIVRHSDEVCPSDDYAGPHDCQIEVLKSGVCQVALPRHLPNLLPDLTGASATPVRRIAGQSPSKSTD